MVDHRRQKREEERKKKARKQATQAAPNNSRTTRSTLSQSAASAQSARSSASASVTRPKPRPVIRLKPPVAPVPNDPRDELTPPPQVSQEEVDNAVDALLGARLNAQDPVEALNGAQREVDQEGALDEEEVGVQGRKRKRNEHGQEEGEDVDFDSGGADEGEDEEEAEHEEEEEEENQGEDEEDEDEDGQDGGVAKVNGNSDEEEEEEEEQDSSDSDDGMFLSIFFFISFSQLAGNRRNSYCLCCSIRWCGRECSTQLQRYLGIPPRDDR